MVRVSETTSNNFLITVTYLIATIGVFASVVCIKRLTTLAVLLLLSVGRSLIFIFISCYISFSYIFISDKHCETFNEIVDIFLFPLYHRVQGGISTICILILFEDASTCFNFICLFVFFPFLLEC